MKPITPDLFADPELFSDHPEAGGPRIAPLAPGAAVLRGFARAQGAELVDLVAALTAQAPFRRMLTPGGRPMSVAMTNCGERGWVSDAEGYRYAAHDPQRGQPWPAMPAPLLELATAAAAAAGFAGFAPDACLINRYAAGARMGLHQDRDERDLTQPIVSISLGLPAVFLFGGLHRTGGTQRVALFHGDVVVWGGPARLAFHGVAALKPGQHALTGPYRYNLTLRRAG